MLNPRVVRFFPHRTASAEDVVSELRKMIAEANPHFKFQCPAADINSLLAGVLPEEVRIFVDDPCPRSGPQPDRDFINVYRSDVFREVIVADVTHAAPWPDDTGIRFSDYCLLVLTDSGIAAVAKNY